MGLFKFIRRTYDEPFNADGERIENVADPINNQDSVTKKSVDDGLALKANLSHPHVEADITDLVHSATSIQGFPIDAPQTGDDGKIYVYEASESKFVLEAKGIYFSAYVEDEAESTTTDNTNWQQKLRLTYTPLQSGNYILEWSAEISSSSNNKGAEIRLEQDDTTELNYSLTAPITANAYVTYSGFKRITLNTNTHNFDIDFKVETGVTATTAKIRRVRMNIRKSK